MNSTTNPIGLTRREHFAALILAGMASNPDLTNRLTVQKMAKHAVRQADMLIERLDELGGELEEKIKPVHEMTDEDKFHREYYRPLYSTEFVKIPESPELDELRNKLYSDEILLGGGE